jgi:diguanylate cyclase (GGDEF)-like protein
VARVSFAVKLSHFLRRLRLPFGARLVLALMVSLVASAALSYVMLHHRLRDDVTNRDARVTQADATTFAAIDRNAASHAETLGEITDILRAVAARPGVSEAKLIDAAFTVVASGRPGDIGRHDRDPRIVAAILDGRRYAGPEADPAADARDLEYLVPLRLGGRPFVYETTRSADDLDAQLASASRTELEAGLLALLVGLLVFVPLGGRLVREHRAALENATLDGLTRLPNHRAFAAELKTAVGRANRHGEQLALLALDVDDFKFVNDRHGHRRGDELLRRVGVVLSDLRASDRAFRTGGDEFVVLLARTTETGARTAAVKLIARLEADGVRVSAGAADLRPGGDHESLHQQADAALYEAKRRGGQGVACFSEIADETSVTSAEAALALRTLLDVGDLECVFQPIWDFRTNRLLAVEALARIPAPYGFSGPAEAFDVAQRTGRVHDLDVLCVTEALRAARELPDDVLLFLNLAPQTLDRDASGDDWLLQAVRDGGRSPGSIVIEVTERVGARSLAVAAAIDRLRTHGFGVAIDDVGSGNSGLEMLRRTHPDYVKIDRSVVAAADDDASARAVLLAVAAFATQTGAFVIAEGIEDTSALNLVKTLGDRLGEGLRIDGGQGFGLGRPSPDLPTAYDAPQSVVITAEA